ncbi:FxsA family protein [Corynebacterium cystitidis]|uniref:FxsA family protein n=1 Tax=Corynebacterium cystitidis TaxID=35757 RepID=UPI00211DD9F6|nr:FxsA family protein [Corynebacterium cystitidis]
MRILLGFLLVEAMVFIAVGAWIGYGWTVLLVLGLMLLGGLAGSASLRTTLLRARTGHENPGKVAGDSGLIVAGWAMSMIPGIVSSVVGLILLFGPTRSVIRRFVATKITRDFENFGMSIYQHSPMAKRHDDYGSFGGGASDRSAAGMVIDNEEIEHWTRKLDPDDFKTDGKGGDK